MLPLLPMLLISCAYLIGSIPFGYLLFRLTSGQDIRQKGSGNIGATNIARASTKSLGLLTLFLDGGKGALAVFLVKSFGETNSLLFFSTALAAVIGHCFPVFLKFKGGKGVATAAGAFAVISPLAVGLAMVIFIIIFILTRYVSLASVLGSATLPVLIYFLNPDSHKTWLLSTTTAGIIVLRHQANIRRLLGGSEPRFSDKGVK